MKAYKINLERKPKFDNITILKKHEDGWFHLCKFRIMNGILYIMSTTNSYISMVALTEEDLILLSLEKEEIITLHKGIVESMKWLEYWTPEYEVISSELYL